MEKEISKQDFIDNFYQENYKDYLNECIELINKEETNDIERVTNDVAEEKIRFLEQMGIGDDYGELVWEVIMDIRGELVKMYNIWFGLIEKEFTEAQEK